MKIEIDYNGAVNLPDVIETDTVTLHNHFETVWHKIDFDKLRSKHPHVTWIVEDNTFAKQGDNHQPIPFFFLYHVVWFGIRLTEGDESLVLASHEVNHGNRHFCFLNNIPRPYRVKLWERLESDELLNEYCSFLRLGTFIGEKNENFQWLGHGHTLSMAPPTFYDSVSADLYCETEVEGSPRFTEKTWKPLFHGKIPLGFGPRHYYKTLMDLGFQFPDIFLDYTFDDIEDTEERFNGFYEQVKRFTSLPLPIKNSIAEHNKRRCFELILESDTPPNLPELHIDKKAEEYLKLGRLLNAEEREEYWHGQMR